MDEMKCTASERILLHLIDYLKKDQQVEIPIAVTQEGIALITCIHRKHIPRSLNKLIENNLIKEKRCHVKGKKQIMKTYSLTNEGRKEAIRLKNKFSDQTVAIILKGKKSMKTISEIHDFYNKTYSYSCIISQVMKHNYFNINNLMIKQINKNETILSPELIYKEALEEAWKDGILTIDERNLLKKLRDTLQISKDVHNKIQHKILQSKKYSSTEAYRQIYDIILEEVMRDNKISKDEEAILKKLKKYFNIDN